MLRMPDFQMQVSRSEEMPAERFEYDASRTVLWDLVGRRNNRTHLDHAVWPGTEATAQIPGRDAGMDVRVTAVGVRLPHVEFGAGKWHTVAGCDATAKKQD